MKEVRKEEIALNNGKNGTTVFIASNGKVYDVSKSSRWENGEHENLHEAGKDLTDDLESAPHGADVLERFPAVGTLKSD